MIAGPPRSGRTTTLLVVAEVLAELYPELEVIGMAMRRSPLRECPALARVVTTLDELPELAVELRTAEQMKILLVDDADVIDDPMRALSDLFSGSGAQPARDRRGADRCAQAARPLVGGRAPRPGRAAAATPT